MELLSREKFKEYVFKRDNYKCVICSKEAKDAHHILERRLFSDFGYYLENGASVCSECHLLAEQTLISCDELRSRCGITKFPIPDHFYKDEVYDKWGNQILPNGQRLKGELFEDQSVQKILQPALYLFTNRIKYPRTYHLPWSEGVSDDDKVQNDLSNFQDKRVIVSVKMDGENTTLYKDYLHARSIEYNPHPSRSWIKSFHAKISHDIPDGWRICGENLYTKHSIKYKNLETYFYLFSIWDDKNVCLSWKDTIFWAELLGIKTVPIIYDEIWDEEKIKKLYQNQFSGNEMEGYVVRLFDSFSYREFRKSCTKMVRKNHITNTHGHWMRNKLEINGL